MSVSRCARHLNISKFRAINYFDNLRGCYVDDLESNPIQFVSLGPYEVDEVYIRHVDRGDGQFCNIWILDILERETGIYWGTVVPDRSARTLVRHICDMIPVGAIVFTDEWGAYGDLRRHGYSHYTVNHSAGEYSRTTTIKRKEVAVHINTLESLHHALRSSMANKSRRHKNRIDLLLGEFIYRHSNRCLFEPIKNF